MGDTTGERNESVLYELRVYECLPGRLPNLNARFADHTLKLFEKHGIKNIGYWTSNIGDYSDRLIYILGFESMEQRERAFAAFGADADWQRAFKESEVDGPLTTRIFNTLLNPTDYSPLR